MNNKKRLNNELLKAIEINDFENIKRLIKEGAEPNNKIIHQIVALDRIDLLQYFLFSPELPKHCVLDYSIAYHNHYNLFVSACSYSAFNIINFILRDPRLCNKFDIKEVSYKSFAAVCYNADIKMMDFLLNKNETKTFCSFEKNDYEIIRQMDSITKRYVPKNFFWEYIFLTLDLNLLEKIILKIRHNNQLCESLLQSRKLNENLKLELKINSKNIKVVKI